MAQAETNNTTPNAQTQLRGYIMSEDERFALLDLGNGLDAIALLCEDGRVDTPELPAGHWAGLLRTFSRQALAIHGHAEFVSKGRRTPQR